MLGAGQETSSMAMAHMLKLLIEHPEDMARVRADPSYTRKVVEETLQLEQPIQWQCRYAMSNVRLGGVHIPEGARILLSWASANHDERKWTDPERFDPGRTDLKDDMGFGRGIHYCIGAPLARLEMGIAFDVLLRRLDDIQLADPDVDLVYPPSPMFRAIAEMKIRFSAAPQLS